MKKLSVILLAAALVLVFTLPAAAIDHIFGGYWRSRAFTQQKFTGEDATDARDTQRVDSRTRLYYTAKFSDDFKFVNKFEFDWQWGDTVLGDIGADGQILEIKNSYVDFNTWGKKLNWTIGIQGYEIAKGFLFADDFSGAIVSYVGDGYKIPFIWMKAYEGGTGPNMNDQDVDYFGLNPVFKMAGFTINPYFLYVYADNGSAWAGTSQFNDVNIFYVGADVSYKLEGWNLWGTAIYNGGNGQLVSNGLDLDFKGYLFALGGNGAIGPVGLHGQFFYASGDDNPNDQNNDAFTPPRGRSYYWSEIMGFGMFDNQVSANSPADGITNIWAINGGANYKLLENLKLGLDLWYASLVEKAQIGAADDPLGTEIDVTASWQIMPKLNLDVVGAYLFAGDGTYSGGNEADPFELGARLSLSF